MFCLFSKPRGQSLVELLLAIGLMAIVIPALITSLVASRAGKPQQEQRLQAISLMKETQEQIRSVREKGWIAFAVNGTYHSELSGSSWSLVAGSASVSGGFTQEITISDVYRDSAGVITSVPGTLDPSTKQVAIAISWEQPYASAVSTTMYMTRYLDNLSYFQTTQAEFNTGTKGGVDVTSTAGGEVQLTTNTKAKWCSPSFSSSTIDLPDGPPVAVSAKSYSVTSTPNDVFAAVAPFATTSAKLAHIQVSANADPPVSSLKGTFTMDASKYSAGIFPTPVPSPNTLDNNFKTNDVKYYQSASGKTYALMATDLPTKEVLVAQVNNGSGDAYEDTVNKIYKYWTFFNTTIYGSGSGENTGFVNPTANSVDSGGDGNGYGSNPTRAYSDNSSYAVDSNSGSDTSTNCTGVGKDRHRYYNYGFSLPASGATIDGIEVRLDAKVDSTTGSPKLCVELSWDGGTSWTTAQSTSTLTTGEVTYALGGAADTWGRTWSTANFSNTNFRLRVSNVASDTARDFSLDWAAVNVHYSGGTSGTNDQTPFGYGATSLTVLGTRGYVVAGGYLYVFDLSNIDSKSPTSGLDMVGCRIEVDGFDCQPGNGTDRKYSAGETGGTWSTTAGPAHPDTCADGGNIELYADNDIYGVQVGGNDYIFVAVGAGTNPEFNIVNASSVPTGSSSPSISSNSCGRASGGNAAWKKVGSKDFNSNTGTEEAANSVYANATATRAYISSNGTADSKQFYILNTTDPTSPKFLNEPPATNTASNGYYQSSGANGEMYPRRSLTVLNGQRVVLVGKDGVSNGNDAEEYQVLNSESETAPAYCGGLDFNAGFNDLTSVVEADADTFVYMVANTTLNELKIIQGGPDGTYTDIGTYESSTLDAGYTTAFNRFSGTVSTPVSTAIGWQFAIANGVSSSCSGALFDFKGPLGTSAPTDLYSATGSAILLGTYGNYSNPGRCMRYKAYFSTTDYEATPVINDVTVNYSP